MDTIYSTNRKLKRMFANILSIFAILAIAFPAMGSASAQEPNPRIVVSEAGNWFWTADFTPGTLNLFLYESANKGAPLLWYGQRDADESGFVVVDDLGLDLVSGNYLVVADEITEKGIVLETITMEVFDTENEIMAGTAPKRREVWAAAGPQDWQKRIMVRANAKSGAWIADFKTIGFDITEDMRPWSYAHIYDEDGDANEAGTPPPPPNPHFTVFPEWEFFDGLDWPDGATVSISVAGKPKCSLERESWGGFFNGNFGEDCDVVVGDQVTFTDGITTRTHTVRNLAVTKVDQADDTVKGVADPGAKVYVWPHATGQEQLAIAKLNGKAKGKWNADFSGIFDLAPGECGRSEIRDEIGNRTAVDWCIPMPTFVAYIPGAIEGYDWPIGDEISLIINGEDYPTTAFSEQRPDSPPGATRVLFEVWKEGISLKAGDHIVMTDETADITKEVTVTNLAVTDFDLSAGKVSGIYDPAYDLWVWLYDLEGQVPETDPDNGTWIATFTELPLGVWGGATQRDADGDGTSIDFQVPGGSVGNFLIEWSQTNPEEVIYLSWNGSDNLTNTWTHPNCSDDLEFFGNSWASENEDGGPFFFASLVGWGTTGDWSQTDATINIQSMSSGCPGSADVPVSTQYRFFEAKPDLMMIQRTFEFGINAFAHDMRAFIPRLYPSDGFTQTLHPNADSDTLLIETTCDFGCVAESWDGSWFAIHNPVTGLGMIVQHMDMGNPVALWLDDDGGSFTNSSAVLLLQPVGGFIGTVTETEYLCFYDSATWTPSLTLPDGCQP